MKLSTSLSWWVEQYAQNLTFKQKVMSHHQHPCLPWRVLEEHRRRCCVESFSSEQAVFSMTHVYVWIIALPEATVVSEKPTVIKCTCAKSFVSSPTPWAASGCLCSLVIIVEQVNARSQQNSAARCESKSSDRCLTFFLSCWTRYHLVLLYSMNLIDFWPIFFFLPLFIRPVVSR